MVLDAAIVSVMVWSVFWLPGGNGQQSAEAEETEDGGRQAHKGRKRQWHGKQWGKACQAA
jgi:hypothetical protein